MQKISSLISSFIFTALGLTVLGRSASVLEALVLSSDNTGVLVVDPNADGTWTIGVVGVGTANLHLVSAADPVNGVASIVQSFPFEVYDDSQSATEVYDDSQSATHFSFSLADFVDKAVTVAIAEAQAGAAAPEAPAATATEAAQTGTAGVTAA